MSEVTVPTPESGTSDDAPDAAFVPTQTASIVAVTPSSPALTPTHHQDPILGFIAPESGVGKELSKIGHEFLDYRTRAINFLHRGVVNHASNVVGATQLVGEVLMFKASGNQLYQGFRTENGIKKTDYLGGKFQEWLKSKHPSMAYTGEASSLTSKGLRYLNPVLEPGYNILSAAFNDAFTKPASTAATTEKVPFTQRLKSTVTTITDTKAATKADLAHSMRVATAEDKIKYPRGRLINRWQTRATLTGMTAMTIAALMPEDKDKPEEVEKLSKLAATSPLSYVGHRIATALNPLEWWDNKRAFIGLGMTVCGMFTMLAGFRNVSKGADGKTFSYYVNQPHAINGGITAAAGSQLLLGVDSEQGWARFGSILWARMIFLPKSITNRYKNSDSAPNFYTAGQGAFQTANITAFMIGGAQKLPDGTVIDQKAIREEAKKKAKIEKAKLKEEKTVPHGHLAATAELAETDLAPALLTAQIEQVAKPGTVIAANEAMHEAPEKSAAIAAA